MRTNHRTRAPEPLAHVLDPQLMQLWAERFGVDVEELKQAVETVGPRVEDLQQELTGIPSLRH
jgi:hypothetical protein